MKVKFGRRYYSRSWSNDELKYVLKYFPLYNSVINVSGWRDYDKESLYYRDYFRDGVLYKVSNYQNDRTTGITNSDDLLINLDVPLPKELEFKFDIAFNHTVLEHLHNPFFSFAQISKLAKIAVISVVPFRQQLHFLNNVYGDYFRFTPFSMRELYQENGLTIIYESCSSHSSPIIYLFYVGVREPERFKNFPVKLLDLETLNGKLVGFRLRHLTKFYLAHGLNKIYNIYLNLFEALFKK